MSEELKALNDRITALQGAIGNELASYVKEALGYGSSDPQSSLTKSRIVLEKLLLNLYRGRMKKEGRQPMIGEMLSDKGFTGALSGRIVCRMNAIRDMSNLGPHGGEVEAADAFRVMRDLIDVLEWHVITSPQGLVAIEFGNLIEQQIALMKGYPLAYLQGIQDLETLERMLAREIVGDVGDDEREEVAFRYSFPQFLDWLRAQPRETLKPDS